MLENLVSHPILSTLALTLIHFLWQGVLIAGALKVMLLLISKQSSLARYSVSCLAMVLSLLVPIATFFWFYQLYSPDNNVLGLSQTLIASTQVTDGVQQGVNLTWYSTVKNYLPFVSMAWMLCVLILTLKLIVELFVVNRLPHSRTVPVSEELQKQFYQLVERLNLKKTPQLVISLKVQVPMAIGWLKPVVLMPASMLTGLTSAQLEMLLMHELAHIRRHDYLVNLLQTLVEIMLFFHPAVTWISKQIRQEREYCSDDVAVAHCGNAVAYAHTLADTASLCKKHRHETIPAMAMLASGGDLKERVIRLVDHQCTASNDAGKWLAGSLLGFSLLLIMSKQFLTIPQMNLTVGEMNLFNLYAKSTRQHQHTDSLTKGDSLIKTTIAQQLMDNQNVTEHIVEQPVSSYFMQPQVNVHAPKLVQIDNKNNYGVNSNADYLSDSTVKRIDDLSSQVKNAPLTQLVKDTSQKDVLNEAVVIYQHYDMQEQDLPDATEELNVLANKTSSINQNPYANQIAELGQDIDTPKINNNSSLAELDAPKQFLTREVSYSQLPTAALKMPSARYSNQGYANQSSELDVPIEYDAELISTSDPRYPSIAKRKGIELDVKVQFSIGKDGKIYNIEFEDQNKVSYFKNAIISAMNKWRFLPAQLNGQPVESQMSKIFSFNLS